MLVPPRAASEAAALTIASQSVGPSTPRRHPTLPAPFRAASAAAATTTTRHPSVTGSTPRRPAALHVSARSRAASEATAATTTSTNTVAGSSTSISQDSAARYHPPVLRPDYAARVTQALASVKEGAKLSPPRAVTAALADFLGVQDVQEWPKGGFLPGYSALSCCCAQSVLLFTSMVRVHGVHPLSPLDQPCKSLLEVGARRS